MKRILVFNVNWLGDVLFSTAVIRNLRRNYPDSFLACAVPGRCYQILKGNPYLDEIIIFDEKERHRGLMSKLKFISFLKGKQFDSVFLLHRSASRAFICWMAGIPERVGYYTRKRGFLLTKKIPAPRIDALHRIDYYLNLIEKAGLAVEDRYTDFTVSEEDKTFADDFLKKSRAADAFLAGINPGGNWMPKRWPKEHWAKLADHLAEKYRAKVVITGSAQDLPLAREIARMMKQEPVIACGALSLKQFGALAKRLDLFITADSGPMHIANAVGAKHIIALFGPTSPELTGPYPSKNVVVISRPAGCAVPCYVVNCKDNRCMKAITPEEVIEQIKLLKVTHGC